MSSKIPTIQYICILHKAFSFSTVTVYQFHLNRNSIYGACFRLKIVTVYQFISLVQIRLSKVPSFRRCVKGSSFAKYTSFSFSSVTVYQFHLNRISRLTERVESAAVMRFTCLLKGFSLNSNEYPQVFDSVTSHISTRMHPKIRFTIHYKRKFSPTCITVKYLVVLLGNTNTLLYRLRLVRY